jgi:adenosine 3'-phospho 5'-phosphosulfate transporter B2
MAINSDEVKGNESIEPMLKNDASAVSDAAATEKKAEKRSAPVMMIFCFIGLQASYLTWGYVQEKVMTKEYSTGKFPSATFCVFSNRVLAIIVALVATVYQHGKVTVPAPMTAFAPCSISNSLSSWGQYVWGRGGGVARDASSQSRTHRVVT